MIEFLEVTKSYLGMRPILESVSLKIDKGEFFYLTGVSGAGKTTVFKLLMLLERADSGQILVDDADLERFNARRTALHRRRIGMIFQDYRLLPKLSIEENTALPLRVAGYRGKALRQKTEACLARVGMAERRKELVKSLSGGEQQLVAISRATVFDPPVVLADEPTGNLDQNTAYTVMKSLREINQRGATVIVATHDLNLIRSFRARTLLIKERRIHEVRLVKPGRKEMRA